MEKSASQSSLASSAEDDAVPAQLMDINSHLMCPLCDGYLREAHTVVECMHTFCKSCLLIKLSSMYGALKCPAFECETTVACSAYQGELKMQGILVDNTMQSLVDKLIPGLVEADDKLETLFYADYKPEVAENGHLESVLQQQQQQQRGSKSGSKSSPHHSSTAAVAKGGSSKRAGKSPKNSRTSDTAAATAAAAASRQSSKEQTLDNPDQRLFRLAPVVNVQSEWRRLPPLDKPVLKSIKNLHVGKMKRFLSTRVGLRTEDKDMIEIIVDGEQTPLIDTVQLQELIQQKRGLNDPTKRDLVVLRYQKTASSQPAA
jgi:Zinc finger, C3HC4 type (RING finger)